MPITLTAGVAICQLALFRLSSDPLQPYARKNGKYRGEEAVSVTAISHPTSVDCIPIQRNARPPTPHQPLQPPPTLPHGSGL